MLIISRIINKINLILENKRYHNLASGVVIPHDVIVSVPDNLIMLEGSEIEPGTVILNNHSKVIFGKYSGSGPNLTIIAGNHMSIVGKFLMQVTDEDKKELDPNGQQDQDVVIGEDVWLGANVTLLNGVHIGRGAVVAAGSVIRTKIPPYAIVAGNPAKVVGFRFTPEQVEEHEKILYPEEERLTRNILDKNYKKYYLDRLKEINNLIRI
ncbi:MAG: galactoside O-acetyltransferase [Bacteroidaceae bacterium]|nr:galactoside O-acetyltransferase [Bacteroidaceae bacterium]